MGSSRSKIENYVPQLENPAIVKILLHLVDAVYKSHKPIFNIYLQDSNFNYRDRHLADNAGKISELYS